MKIVQSYWSKPILAESEAPQNRTWGGWPSVDFFYCSWALSCLQLRRFYNKLELVTDTPGADLLADALQLPYTQVTTTLNELQDTHPGLWALGKLHAQLAQQEPFIHADGDVITWQKFDDALEAAPLLAQNKDIGYDFYTDSLNEIRTHNGYIPPIVEKYFTTDEQLIALNCGIVGGNDLAFIHQYCHAALDFVQRNNTILSKIKTGKFNAVYEQYLLSCMARHAGIAIQYYYGNEAPPYERFVDYLNVPRQSTYFHPVGLYKKNYTFCTEIKKLLQLHYPVYYERIQQLLRKQNNTVLYLQTPDAPAQLHFPLTLALAEKIESNLPAQWLALAPARQNFANAVAPQVLALQHPLQPALHEVLQLEAAIVRQLEKRSGINNFEQEDLAAFAQTKQWLAQDNAAIIAARYVLHDSVELLTLQRAWVPEYNIMAPVTMIDAVLASEPDEYDVALKPLPGADLPVMVLPLTGFLSLLAEFAQPVSLQFIIDELLNNEELMAMDDAGQLIDTVVERVKWMLNEGLIVVAE
jgi:hypothetical protein